MEVRVSQRHRGKTKKGEEKPSMEKEAVAVQRGGERESQHGSKKKRTPRSAVRKKKRKEGRRGGRDEALSSNLSRAKLLSLSS
jgi:hypothetical protein